MVNTTVHFKSEPTKIIFFFGKYIIALLFSLGQTFLNFASIYSFFVLHLNVYALCPALLICYATWKVCWKNYGKIVPEMLARIQLNKTAIKKFLSKPINILGLLFSCSVGITFATLVGHCIATMPLAFPLLTGASVIFPPIAILLASVTLINVTFMMAHGFSHFSQSNSFWLDLKSHLTTHFSLRADLPHNMGKTLSRLILERIFSFLILMLTFLGLAMTMYAGNASFIPTVESLFSISTKAANILGSIICLGLAIMGQLPFILNTTIKCLQKIFNTQKAGSMQNFTLPNNLNYNISPTKTASNKWHEAWAICAALGSGAVCYNGASSNLSQSIAAVGAFGTTTSNYAAAFVADTSNDTSINTIPLKQMYD